MAKAKNRQSGKREPNGRLSRQQKEVEDRVFAALDRQERETLETGLAARERVHGVPRTMWDAEQEKHVAVSRDPRVGTFLGRLYIGKEISRAQYEAGVLWGEHVLAYQRAIAAPRQPGAIDLNATKGRGTEREDVEATRRAIVRMVGDKERGIVGAHEAIQNEQYSLANQGSRFALLFVLWTAIERDEERYDIVADLRVALNCLARHFGLMGQQQRRAA